MAPAPALQAQLNINQLAMSARLITAKCAVLTIPAMNVMTQPLTLTTIPAPAPTTSSSLIPLVLVNLDQYLTLMITLVILAMLIIVFTVQLTTLVKNARLLLLQLITIPATAPILMNLTPPLDNATALKILCPILMIMMLVSFARFNIVITAPLTTPVPHVLAIWT